MVTGVDISVYGRTNTQTGLLLVTFTYYLVAFLDDDGVVIVMFSPFSSDE
uniref:Uncharacterized protein n=1 Tax=Glossina palpalis gambiensis TaxID=67801 RepID=A0A1B0BK43_9MUSC